MTVSRDLTPIDASAEPWTVVPTQAEREAGTLSPESIARAVEGLNREGVIVLKGVVDLDHVRILRDRVLSDIEQYETDGASEKIEQGGVGWWHNWQGGRPPPLREFLFDDICYNEFVIAAVSGAARPHMAPDWGGWMGGGYGLINMAFKGNMIQEVSPGCLSSALLPCLLMKRIVARRFTRTAAPRRSTRPPPSTTWRGRGRPASRSTSRSSRRPPRVAQRNTGRGRTAIWG